MNGGVTLTLSAKRGSGWNRRELGERGLWGWSSSCIRYLCIKQEAELASVGNQKPCKDMYKQGDTYTLVVSNKLAAFVTK
jgi:hypothetical protein